jgi:hypothetical protein
MNFEGGVKSIPSVEETALGCRMAAAGRKYKIFYWLRSIVCVLSECAK